MLFATLIATLAFGASPESFPMSKGSYWIYRGNVSWQDDDEIKSRKIEWKMEVTESISRADGVVAVLKGHPGDLTWFEPGRDRGNYLLIKIGDSRYYLLQESRFDQAYTRVEDPAEPLDSLVRDHELILQLPLKPGSRFGEADQMNRSDNMYTWYVESVKRGRYDLTFSTNPDHLFITYVRGTGITSFIYGHHGTVSLVDVRLAVSHVAK